MSTFWTLYLVAALTTTIMSYFMLFRPSIGVVEKVLEEVMERTDTKSEIIKRNAFRLLHSRFLVAVIFCTLVFIAFPFILPAIFLHDKKELFITKFVEGALHGDD